MIEAEDAEIQVPEECENKIERKVDQFDAQGQELGEADGFDILGNGGQGHQEAEYQDELIKNLHPHNEGLAVIVAHEKTRTTTVSDFLRFQLVVPSSESHLKKLRTFFIRIKIFLRLGAQG